MRLKEAIENTNHETFSEDLAKKRFACAQCGKTWVELVGAVGAFKDGNEDLYLQIGTESEVCQTCRFRPRVCPECGSKDAYEIKFPSSTHQDVPLSFEAIRRVNRR